MTFPPFPPAQGNTHQQSICTFRFMYFLIVEKHWKNNISWDVKIYIKFSCPPAKLYWNPHTHTHTQGSFVWVFILLRVLLIPKLLWSIFKKRPYLKTSPAKPSQEMKQKNSSAVIPKVAYNISKYLEHGQHSLNLQAYESFRTWKHCIKVKSTVLHKVLKLCK